jgi:hypothetical protein
MSSKAGKHVATFIRRSAWSSAAAARAAAAGSRSRYCHAAMILDNECCSSSRRSFDAKASLSFCHHHQPRSSTVTTALRRFGSKDSEKPEQNQQQQPKKSIIDQYIEEHQQEIIDEKSIDKSQFKHEILIKVPDVGQGQHENKVTRWYKEPGDIVQREDILCDIKTPGFTFGMATDDEDVAIMGKILIEAGSENVNIDDVLCIILHKTPPDEGEEKGTENEAASDEKEGNKEKETNQKKEE